MSLATVNLAWNIPFIATSAGAVEFHCKDDVLHADCSQAALDAAIASYDHTAELAKPSKTVGFEYSGVMIPVTNEDASGAMQIKIGFEEMGMVGTKFDLSNGLTIHLTSAEWPTFKAAFFMFRASFF